VGASLSKREFLRQVTSNIGQVTVLHDPSTTEVLLPFAGLATFHALTYELMENFFRWNVAVFFFGINSSRLLNFNIFRLGSNCSERMDVLGDTPAIGKNIGAGKRATWLKSKWEGSEYLSLKFIFLRITLFLSSPTVRRVTNHSADILVLLTVPSNWKMISFPYWMSGRKLQQKYIPRDFL